MDDIMKQLRKFHENRNLKQPQRMSIKETEKAVRISIRAGGIQADNMQTSGNNFEGWMFAIYNYLKASNLNKKLILDVAGRFKYDGYKTNGHLCRFLYRALRFNEQYSWCDLSDYLKDETDKFKEYLSKGCFVNNTPYNIADRKSSHDEENAAEEWLAKGRILKTKLAENEKKLLDIGDNDVYRQLPVGLFEDKDTTPNRVFTAGKSAIDLWTFNGNELNVVELKTKNAMLGIITEIFFYSNYMRDLVMDGGLFKINTSLKGNDTKKLRGYLNLLEKKFKKINGIMLADDVKEFHPLVNGKIVDIMNKNSNVGIKYYLATYPYNEIER